MRQRAWLTTTPDRREGEPEGGERLCRLDQLERDDMPVLVPPNAAPHLTEWLYDIGPTVDGAMGEAAFGWADMEAWQRLTGIALLPWEARILRRLSREFAAQRSRSRDPDCPPPYDGKSREEAVARRDRVTAQFARMMQTVQAQQAPDAKEKD